MGKKGGMAMHRIGLLEGGTGCAWRSSGRSSPLAGRSLEPQEVPLRGFAGVAPELVLAWAGVLLLAGIPPEKLPAARA